MGMNWKRIGLIVGGVLLLLVAVHGGIWWWAVAAIERELVANLAAPPFPGWRVCSLRCASGPPRHGCWTPIV